MRPDEFFYLWTEHFIDPDGADLVMRHAVVLEFLLWLAVFAIAVSLLRSRTKLFDTISQYASRVAEHRMVTVALVGWLAMALRVAVLPLVPIPEPLVHDEFSYILQAQTFASGRLTNPTPPLWVHFDTFHVNMRPTYQSMYPPAQAIFLALGLRLFGHPWWGIWLSLGMMCAAITWMLQAWMPPRWALLGGLFCVLRFSIASYWVNSYFGGTLPAFAGALVMGVVPRLIKKPTVAVSITLGAGLMLLANSRPYEGFLFSIPPLVWLLCWHFRYRAWNTVVLRKMVAPTLAVLAICGAAMLYYNWRNTGHPTLMPYVLNQKTYHISKPFLWQTRYPIPHYNHLVMRTFYCYHELPSYFRSRTYWGLGEITVDKFRVYYEFFVWPLLLLLLPTLLQMIKSQRAWLLAVTMLWMMGGILLESWPPEPHYASPVLCAVIAGQLYGLRLLRTWKLRNQPLGLALCRGIVIVFLVWSLVPIYGTLRDPFHLGEGRALPSELERARLQAQLERLPGRQLVLVHIRRTAAGSIDWVYNRPDIEKARVIWARDMGTEANEELVQHFRDRHIWIVDENDGVIRLSTYTGHSSVDTLASAIGLRQNPDKP